MTSLKEQIAARIQESRDKDIDGKARTIARALGTTYEDPDQDGSTSRFVDALFEIESGGGVIHAHDGDMGWSNATVKYKSDTVYQEGGCTVSTFIPGDWEVPFEALYSAARIREAELARQEKAKRDQARLEAEARERAKWGL